MAEEPDSESWTELRSRRPVSDDGLVTKPIRRDGLDTAILMGMNREGHLHLLVPLPDPTPRREIPDLIGLHVRVNITDQGPYLALVATAPHEGVFTPVCRELIQAVHAEAREPWAATATIVRHWQSAWRPLRQQMSAAVQIGLAGELLVLSRVFIPVLGPAGVLVWSGPDAERHDFIAGDLHLEVKTTRSNRQEHEISRLDQLHVPLGRFLLLASVRLEVSIGGVHSLATLIDEVIELIRNDPAAVDDFLLKLSQLNWSDDLRRSSELLRFHLSDAAVYEVDAAFPRLDESFQPPTGVIAVRYTISLANLPSLDINEVSDRLRLTAMARSKPL